MKLNQGGPAYNNNAETLYNSISIHESIWLSAKLRPHLFDKEAVALHTAKIKPERLALLPGLIEHHRLSMEGIWQDWSALNE